MNQLKEYVKCNKTTICISILFVVVYVLNLVVGDDIIFDALSGSGFKKINGEYYRIITNSILHASTLHIVANIIALLCVGSFLEREFGSLKMLLLYICLELVTSISFYAYMNECTNGNGFFGNYNTFIIHGFSFAVGLAAGGLLLKCKCGIMSQAPHSV